MQKRLLTTKGRKKLGRAAIYCFAVLASFYLVAHFAWLVISSFMTDAEAISIPVHLIPEEPTLEHWQDYLFPKPAGETANIGAATARVFRRGVLNSMIIAISVTIANLVIASFAAYSLARIDFMGSSLMMLFYLLSRSVPAVAIMIPMIPA